MIERNWRKQEITYKLFEKFDPLLPGLGDDSILVHFPPPPLHLVDLGPVNNVLHLLEKTVGPLTSAWELIGVTRKVFHGGNFNGKELNKILSKLDILENFVPPQFSAFISSLESIKNLKLSICRQGSFLQIYSLLWHKIFCIIIHNLLTPTAKKSTMNVFSVVVLKLF